MQARRTPGKVLAAHQLVEPGARYSSRAPPKCTSTALVLLRCGHWGWWFRGGRLTQCHSRCAVLCCFRYPARAQLVRDTTRSATDGMAPVVGTHALRSVCALPGRPAWRTRDCARLLPPPHRPVPFFALAFPPTTPRALTLALPASLAVVFGRDICPRMWTGVRLFWNAGVLITAASWSSTTRTQGNPTRK